MSGLGSGKHEVICTVYKLPLCVLASHSAAATPPGRYLINKFKMRAVTIFLLLACVVAMAYGDLVCGTNYCKQHPCTATVAQSSCRNPSVYRPNHSGKCGCCPACVTFLNEGAACKTYSKELGETPLAICQEPLKCLQGVCTKATTRV